MKKAQFNFVLYKNKRLNLFGCYASNFKKKFLFTLVACLMFQKGNLFLKLYQDYVIEANLNS